MSTTPINIILCGKIPSHQAAVPKALEPEYNGGSGPTPAGPSSAPPPQLLPFSTPHPSSCHLPTTCVLLDDSHPHLHPTPATGPGLTLSVLAVFPTVSAFALAFPTLVSNPDTAPAIIFMGGGFDREEFREAYAVSGAAQVPWARPGVMRADVESVTGKTSADEEAKSEAEGAGMPAGGPPSAEQVAAAARKVCDEHKVVLLKRGGAGEVWYY